MWRRVFLKIKDLCKQNIEFMMAAKPGDKRSVDGSKKGGKSGPVHQEVREDRKRKVALLLAYNGHGYYGLQLNPGMKSIEGDLIKALLDVGVIPQDHHDNVQKMSMQRASRTDKGVSAVGNIISLKMLLNVENLLDKINEKLPAQIRVMDCLRTTKGFNSKQHCCARTYHYLLPTFAFAPCEMNVTEDYRTDLDTIEKVNEILEKFVGTHNFHNFTSGIKPTEQRALRTIRSFESHLPFIQDGLELCVMSVHGQSFMLHQIRKMIGLTIAIVRGYANMDAIDKAWGGEKMDVPKAPGLGLMLEKLHYDTYNRKFCADGSHPKLEFTHLKEKLQQFKKDVIYPQIIKQEKEEQSMMDWLSKLHLHSCDTESNWLENRDRRKFRVEREQQLAEGGAGDGSDSDEELQNVDGDELDEDTQRPVRQAESKHNAGEAEKGDTVKTDEAAKETLADAIEVAVTKEDTPEIVVDGGIKQTVTCEITDFDEDKVDSSENIGDVKRDSDTKNDTESKVLSQTGV